MRVLIKHWPWRWCLYWLVLPNIVMIAMWPIGGPPMGSTIVALGALALVFSQLRPLWARRMAVAGLTLVSTFEYVINSFNLEITRVDALREFLLNVHPLASIEYLAGVVILIAALVLAVRGVAKTERFGPVWNWALGFVAVLALAQADTLATAATSNTYRRLPPAGTPFHSAVNEAGIGHPGPARHNLVVILVEALGYPVFPKGHQLFEADWHRPEWNARYQVSYGRIPYFGSTTNGELRELCGVYSNYDSFDFGRQDCMPARYTRAGYDTLALHGFEGAFFDRTNWWPRAGFEHTMFREQLEQDGARRCGGMWPGACDVDVAKQIGRRLKTAQRPQFIYWVTLNTHLPVLDGATPGMGGCENGTAPLASMSLMECRLFVAYHDVAQAISALAMDPDLPPTDILMVGDHMPPFMDRTERLDFDGYSVPWIYLRAKDHAPR